MSAQVELMEATKRWNDKAMQVFQRTFDMPAIQCDLRGQIAGQAFRKSWRVRYNPELYERNKQTYVDRTVPHELAHLIASTMYPGCSSHGREWQNVMTHLGVQDATRCHSYDTSKLETGWARPYVYKCNCKEHHLTHTVHKRIRMGRAYKCNRCRRNLEYVRVD